jgi:hypothetical protein
VKTVSNEDRRIEKLNISHSKRKKKINNGIMPFGLIREKEPIKYLLIV